MQEPYERYFEAYSRTLRKVRTRREMATLRGHLTNIQDISFSPDGTLLVSYGDERSRLWDGGPYVGA